MKIAKVIDTNAFLYEKNNYGKVNVVTYERWNIWHAWAVPDYLQKSQNMARYAQN